MVYKKKIRDALTLLSYGNNKYFQKYIMKAMTLLPVKGLLDTIMPRICSGCGNQLLADESYICPSCILSLNLADKTRIEAEFNKNFLHQNYLTAFVSLYIFQKDSTIQNIIHAIKYGKKFRTGEYLGGIAGRQFHDQIAEWKIDVIVPVPLHPVKKVERGYNQSYYIAKGISNVSGIPCKSGLLKRIRYTETQTHMTHAEREANISGAFKCRKNIPPVNYLLIDDVITTGSTLMECARVLKEKGADKVCALSLAIAD